MRKMIVISYKDGLITREDMRKLREMANDTIEQDGEQQKADQMGAAKAARKKGSNGKREPLETRKRPTKEEYEAVLAISGQPCVDAQLYLEDPGLREIQERADAIAANEYYLDHPEEMPTGWDWEHTRLVQGMPENLEIIPDNKGLPQGTPFWGFILNHHWPLMQVSPHDAHSLSLCQLDP